MEIPQSRLLIQQADHALARGRDPKGVITAYMAITVAVSALAAILSQWLNQQISGTGGLSQLSTRAIFSTVQSILPLAQSVILMSIQMGYLHAMLRIGRGQYADHTDLKVGFQRFFPMLRMALLTGLLYSAVGLVTFYFSMQIFAFTPWYEQLYTILMPVMDTVTVVNPTYAIDELTLMQALEAMIPMLVLYGALYFSLAVVLSYRFRMASYALLDNPKAGAIAALRASTRLMRRNGIRLFKLDLRFWWYYGLSFLANLICYGDVILPMMGIQLPLSGTAAYFLFFGAYLAALFAISCLFRNKVELTYIMAYEAICDKPKDDGVVLGNIFDL